MADRRLALTAAALTGTLVVALLAPLVVGPGLPRGHDLVLELVRFEEFARALGDGVLRPRWAANLNGGYGYPIFDFFPLVLLYLEAIARLAGLSLNASVQIALGGIIALGAYGSYRLGRLLGGQAGALVAMVAFVASPYVAHDLYVRDAWSELAALCLAPGALAAVMRTARAGQPRDIAAAALWLALLAMSHNLSAAMYAPIFAIGVGSAWVGGWRDDGITAARSVASVGLAVVIALLCAATYLLPIFALSSAVPIKYEPTGNFDVLNNLLDPAELFAPPWAAVAAFGVVGAAAALLSRRLAWAARVGLATALALLVVVPTEPFRWVWENARPLKILQFPWRLYSPTSLLTIVALAQFAGGRASGAPDRRFGSRALAAIGATCATAAIALTATTALRQPRIDDPTIGAPARLRAERVTTTTLDEFVPRTVETFPERPANPPAAWQDDSATPTVVEYLSHAQRYTIAAPVAGELLLRTFYFPGWTVSVDGVATSPRITRRGTMAITVEAGEHVVDLRMERTAAHKLGDALSLLGLLIVLVMALAQARSRAARETTTSTDTAG